MTERPHKRLIAWQKAMDFIEEVYRVTGQFPDEERFGLVAQMRRASISVASNIAEGAARQTTKETLQFFFIARGSVSELDTQIEIAQRLRFLSEEQRMSLSDQLEELGRLLNGLVGRGSTRPTHFITASLPHSHGD